MICKPSQYTHPTKPGTLSVSVKGVGNTKTIPRIISAQRERAARKQPGRGQKTGVTHGPQRTTNSTPHATDARDATHETVTPAPGNNSG